MAHARRSVGRYEESIELFRRALELRAWNHNASLELAVTLALCKDVDAAMELARSIPADGYLTRPWHQSFVWGEIEYCRAQLRWAEEDPDGAREATQSALRHFKASLALVDGDRFAIPLLESRVFHFEQSLAGDVESQWERFMALLLENPVNSALQRAASVRLRLLPPSQIIQESLADYFSELSKLGHWGEPPYLPIRPQTEKTKQP